MDVHRLPRRVGTLELYAYFTGTSATVLANVAARVVIVGLFLVLSRTRA